MISRHRQKGFTLIELLIVIAIILILISIALPNFLEAQIRAKVAKATGEVRTLVIATESYKADWKGNEPIPYIANPGPVIKDPATWNWWGFASHGLTSPIKYLSSLPIDPFGDNAEVTRWWRDNNKVPDQPYTVIRITRNFAKFTVGQAVSPPLASIRAAAGGNVIMSEDFVRNAKHCGYIYYSSGPDAVDSTAWVCPQTYSPTNGTNSFGDIYAFGPGSPTEDDNRHLLQR